MDDCIDEIIRAEGGAKVTNDPDDNGGLTKFGISHTSHPNVDIASLTREQAREIYEREYLIDSGIVKVQPKFLQDQLLDMAVNQGVTLAIRTLQMFLGVDRDGKIGPHTLSALSKVEDFRVLNNKICAAREAYYFHLAQAHPKNKKYLKGWRARAKKFYIE